jgi:protein SCO1/2
MSRRARLGLTAAIVVAAVAVGWIVVLPRLRPHVFHGAVIQSSTAAPEIDLVAHTGERMSLAAMEGKVVVLYFGYTYCPDVCPTTLSRIDKALDLLGDDAADVQTIMVSVDPERDSPEVLARYLPAFDPGFIGLTGTRAEVAQVATAYGVFFEKSDDGDAGGYLVDHTATVMVVDRNGYLKLVLPFDASAEDIADDVGYLVG